MSRRNRTLIFWLFAGTAFAQSPGDCVVNILNRTSVVGANSRWRMENVPTLQGPVRARFTCTSNGVTQYGPTPFYLMNEFTGADITLGCAERATWSSETMTISEENMKQVRLQTRRALLALGAATAAAIGAGNDVLLAPRIIKSSSTREGTSDEILSVALCKFKLPTFGERIAYRPGKKRSQLIGSNVDTRCSALLVVKSSAASLSNRGRVMIVALLPENHLWADNWACDVTWDDHLRRWIFGLATYSPGRVEVSLYEVSGDGVFAYPFPFELSYWSPWPEPPVAVASFGELLPSAAGSVQKLSIAPARRGLTTVLVHNTAGVLASHYDWTSRTWGGPPISNL